MPDVAIDNLTSAEIGNLIDNRNDELSQAIKDNDTVLNEDLEISRAILELQLKRKTTQQAMIKSKSNIKLLSLEIKCLTNRFWQAKHSGL